MTDIHTIDTNMHGLPGVTAAYLVRGERIALVETGPKSVVQHVFAGLDSLGIDHLDWIIVTHVHLDHAGAAGTLAQRYPDAKVGVHEVGAPHLVNPSKLWSSASRIYGDEMDRLWGGIDPIDPDRIHVIADEEVIDLGGARLHALDTPGHAYHHHAYLLEDEGAVFTGDAIGVRLRDVGIVRPTTPPPEFHLDKTLASMERIRNLGATTLYPTHFGAHDQGERTVTPDELLDEAAETLRTWGRWVQEARTETRELDGVADRVAQHARSAMEASLDDEAVHRMNNTTSYQMNVWGYMRYFDKAEASQAPAGA